MPTEDHKLSVFINYSEFDKSVASELNKKLIKEGWIEPWFFDEKMLAGLEWEVENEKALEASDIVILLLSENSINREGYIQKEIGIALELSERKPPGAIYIIPLRLEECAIPIKLNKWKYINYFPKSSKRKAYNQLLNSLKKKAIQIGDEKLIKKINEKNKPVKKQDVTEEKETLSVPKPTIKIEPTINFETVTANINAVGSETPKQIIEKKPDLIKKKRKIFGVDVTPLRAFLASLVAIIGLVASILGILDYFGIKSPISVIPTATQSISITVIPPTPQENNPSGDIPIVPNATSIPSGSTAGQTITALEFKGNIFTAKQIACMTPTIIPIQGANTIAFLPGGQLLAVDMGEGDEEKIGILNIQNKTWDKFMDGKLLAQTPLGPMFVRGTDYDLDPNYILLAQNESLVLTLTDVVVTAFAASPDGKTMAFGYESGQIEIKRLDTGKSKVLLGSTSPTEHLVFSPDSSLLASGSDGNFLWDVNNGSLLQKLPQGASPVSFSPDGKDVLFKSSYEIDAWNIATEQTRTVLTLQNNWVNGINAAPFLSNDASLLVTGNTFWNVPEMTLLRSLNEHDTYNTAMIAGSFEGDKLVSATTAEIIVWDLNCSQSKAEPTQKPLNFEPITANNVDELKLAHSFEEDADFGSFSYQSNRFVMGGQVYSLADMNPISNFSKYIYGGAQAVAISPDGKFLTSEKDVGKLSIWDVDNDHWGNILDGCGGSPVFTPDGKLLAVNQEKKEICIWNNLSSAPQKVPLLEEVGGANRGGDIVVTTSGVYQSTHLYDGKKFALFDVFSNKTQPKLVLPETVEWAAFSPAGHFLVSKNMNGKSELSVFDIKRQTVRKDFGYSIYGYSYHGAFSIDDTLFAILIGDDAPKIQVYNTSNWQLITEIDPIESMDRFVFSPDGHYFVMTGSSKTYFWSVNGL